jgi:hypothetical protein
MIPGELTVDNSFTVDVSDDFTGTIAIGQAELHGHFGLTGSLGGTKRYGAVSTKANSQVGRRVAGNYTQIKYTPPVT